MTTRLSELFSRAKELETCSTDEILSFDVRFVTIADAVKIASFSHFLQGYSLWFFHSEIVDPRVRRRRFGRRWPSSREVIRADPDDCSSKTALSGAV
jgi:hypothetical protein